ncbi:hypothetical protein RFX58_02640, partial [Acinetobacter baumannii]|nr:hypothetical protein [Acinetobacter baumannii]
MLRPWQIHFRIDEREEKTVFLKLTNLISQEIFQSFEEQKAQFAQPQPKLTEFQKMLNAVN